MEFWSLKVRHIKIKYKNYYLEENCTTGFHSYGNDVSLNPEQQSYLCQLNRCN